MVRSLFLGMASAGLPSSPKAETIADEVEDRKDDSALFASKWHRLPDMTWTGEDLWAQRLQDWCIRNKELVCLQAGPDRTVHILTHQLTNAARPIRAEFVLSFGGSPSVMEPTLEHYAGIRVGLKGRFADYRSAIFTGKGINVGIGRNGRLFIGNIMGEDVVEESMRTSHLRLIFTVETDKHNGAVATLSAVDRFGNAVASVRNASHTHKEWEGSIALVSHSAASMRTATETIVSFKELIFSGEGLAYNPRQVYGPIYFAQYTVSANVLKLTAQLAPMDISGNEVKLQIQRNYKWVNVATARVHPLARTATFRVEKWQADQRTPYRLVYTMPLQKGKAHDYYYEGSIATDPRRNEVKALCFSCNWDHGFPDNEVVDHALKHDADMVFFLGDQFYESNGGFGIQVDPLDKACLDYLRKWYQFGWSYRDLFRHCPMMALPDDHDVYHGNIWGAGGRAAIATGGAAIRQDSGGYKMSAEWVNMAQITQTSHMPDAFDPTPVQQQIGVYYTSWHYAGIHFAVIEDRKFKSPPKDVLPQEANVYNGYAGNPAYDRTKELEAELLGVRQMTFLQKWKTQHAAANFNVLISATSFACLQTLPAGSKSDQSTPGLAIPAKGQYVQGDAPTRDMDSNGWPQKMRNEIVKLLGKDVHLHICGDQHLPSVMRYGTDQFNDGCWCFTVPALSNAWPRRWWPAKELNQKPFDNRPDYCGQFLDGFDNKLTVHAVANPHITGNKPSILYDRVTGYGLVKFSKLDKKIILECWPRKAAVGHKELQQYEGWPVVLTDEDFS
jgi:phosphodiesterase/alkaline phosphatase D-like protein